MVTTEERVPHNPMLELEYFVRLGLMIALWLSKDWNQFFFFFFFFFRRDNIEHRIEGYGPSAQQFWTILSLCLWLHAQHKINWSGRCCWWLCDLIRYLKLPALSRERPKLKQHSTMLALAMKPGDTCRVPNWSRIHGP